MDDNSSNGWLVGHKRVRLCKQSEDLQATKFNGRQDKHTNVRPCADGAAANVNRSLQSQYGGILKMSRAMLFLDSMLTLHGIKSAAVSHMRYC